MNKIIFAVVVLSLAGCNAAYHEAVKAQLAEGIQVG